MFAHPLVTYIFAYISDMVAYVCDSFVYLYLWYICLCLWYLLILVIYLPMFVLFDVWCDVPPDKDKCAREKIATLPLYHLITSDQDKCWPGHDGSCRKIGTAQNDYFDFCQTAKKEWLLLSCTEEWVDDVDDQWCVVKWHNSDSQGC